MTVTMVTRATKVSKRLLISLSASVPSDLARQPPTEQIMVLLDTGGAGTGAGLHYEVVLEKAKTRKMPRPQSAPVCRKYEDIQQKLQVKLNK